MTVLVSASTQAAFLFRALESGVDVTGGEGDLAEEVSAGEDSGSSFASPSEEGAVAAVAVAEFSLSEEEEAPSASSSPILFSPPTSISPLLPPSSPASFSPFSRAAFSASALLLLLSPSDSVAGFPLPFSLAAAEAFLDLHGWFSLLQVSTLC